MLDVSFIMRHYSGMDNTTNPCDTGCQYSKDVGMWPEHSCGNGCMYDEMPEMQNELNAPSIIDIGFMGVCTHRQPCAIYHSGDNAQPAVLKNLGAFHPSWKAQQEGWKLVQAKTGFQRWVLKRFFNLDNS